MMLRPWSEQARQLTPRRETVAHLGNQGCCVHIHTGNLSTDTYNEYQPYRFRVNPAGWESPRTSSPG